MTTTRLVGNKTGATRLSFSLILKFFAIEARFPRHAREMPRAAVDYVAGQVKVDPALWGGYDWSGRSIERHRAQIREELGFREATRDDEVGLIEWLAAEICPVVLNDEGVRAALLARCRKRGIEPPGRLERILGGARSRFDKGFCADVVDRLSAESIDKLEELAAGRDGFLVELKSDPGPLGLDSLLEEIVKLGRAKAIGLPADLLSGYSEKLVAAWRARAAACYPSDLLANPRAVRLTLLAALCWSRTSEISDALVDLLIQLVARINTRAERKVENQVTAEAMKVHGKTTKLFRIAEAPIARPDGTVRAVVYPVVDEVTLRRLVAEAKADEKAFKARVRMVLTSSYSGYYRRMLPQLLAALDFNCNNTAYRPVMDALDLLHTYVGVASKVKHYAATDRVPIKGVVPDGAGEFIASVKELMRRRTAELATAIEKNRAGGVKVKTVRGEARWHVPELGKLPVPANLAALHAEVGRRWGTIELLDFLKEADFYTRFTDAFSSVATRETTPRPVIRKRLLLVLHSLGINIGIKRIVAAGNHADRGDATFHPCAVRQPRQPTQRPLLSRQRNPQSPRPTLVGTWHRLRLRFQEIRFMVE